MVGPSIICAGFTATAPAPSSSALRFTAGATLERTDARYCEAMCARRMRCAIQSGQKERRTDMPLIRTRLEPGATILHTDWSPPDRH
jgi:hypothetical protein